MKLDEAFEKKDDIAKEIKESLTVKMQAYGFEIPDALVTDIDPAEHVKAAMNEIQAQERLRVAATAKGEANKVIVVKEAEAQAQSKKLQGEGIANQRKAIIEGLRESVKAFGTETGVSAEEAMKLVILTQYFDMMRDVGVSAGSKVIMTSHSPGAVSDIMSQISNAIITGGETVSAPASGKSPAASDKKAA
jgi:regulator of protease activity HflC (stomatin/prohibitin superfamily)